MNNVLVGTANGLSGNFTIPAPYATVGCNQTIKGVLLYNSGSGCTLNLGEYTFNNLVIENAVPIVLPANGSSTVSCITSATAPTTPVVTSVCGNAIVLY